MTAIPGPSGAEPGESRALAGYPVTPPALPRPVIFDQRWTDLTFIHWPVLPESVAGSYPPGTRPDVFADGMTYVGLVPFRMSSTKLGTALPIPYVGTFPETNVRLYSIDNAGRHGVLFRSLETARLTVVPLTRIGLGIPYAWSNDRPVGHRGHHEQVCDVTVQHRGALAGECGPTVAPNGPNGGSRRDVVATDGDRSDPRAGKQTGEQALALLVVAHAQNRFDRKHRGRKGNWGERPAEFGKRDRGLD